MPCDELPDDLKVAWKEAGMDGHVFSPDQLRAEAEKLLAKRRRGYLVAGVVCSTMVATYAVIIFNFHIFHNMLMLIGSSLSLVGFGYLLVETLIKRSRALPELGETDGLRFYRTELERKRDWICWVAWRLPLIWVPVFLVDLGVTQWLLKTSAFLAGANLSLGLVLLVFVGTWVPVRNNRIARKYQERIDALDLALKSGKQTGPKD